MHNIFEENMGIIRNKLKKRIEVTIISTIILCILDIILSFLLFDYIQYILFFYFFTLLIGVLPYLFNLEFKKIDKYIKEYHNNKQDVIDYLTIIIKNALLNQRNFILRHYYKNIIEFYISALNALKEI